MSMFNQTSAPESPEPAPRKAKVSPLAIVAGVLAVAAGFIYVSAHVWTEVLWFQQMGAGRVIFTRWGAAAGMFLLTFVLGFAVFTLNLRLALRARQDSARGSANAAMRVYQEIVDRLQPVVVWVVPAVMAAFIAVGVATQWRVLLTAFNGTPFNEVDPIFGWDISFFVFTLPALHLIVTVLLQIAALTVVVSAAVHYLYGSIRLVPRPGVTPQARLHIGIIAAVISLLFGARYWLARYELLIQQGDTFDGALYADVNATLPAQSILAGISVVVAILFVAAAFRGTWRLPVIGVVLTVVSSLIVGTLYPTLIQQFRVTPNARQLEAPYIQHNINATLKAYGLDKLEYQTYAARTEAKPGQLREDAAATSQIRLLDPLAIAPAVRQLQQSRPYYSFNSGMRVDRYTIDGKKRDTVIAMRELNTQGLSPEQRTWVNLHTVYTHGFGVVAAYGNSVTPDGLPAYWEQSIPSTGEMGEYEPRIYFSPEAPEYSIVGAPEGAQPQELDYPDDNAPGGQVSTTFKGNGGPSVGNFWNKLLYSIRFGSTDIFFSSQTNSESQILYDRDPLLRVSKVAPYLTLEQDAYPAVVDTDGDPSTPKRLLWVVDAYTTTANYPYSQHQSLDQATLDSRTKTASEYLQSNSVNYMRNSVKAIVDAYDGSVRLFQWDKEDPILATWMKIYPDMVEPIENISGDLMSHLRYPEDMFKVQRELLTSYHVTEAGEFYTGGDRWRLAQDTATITQANAGSGEAAKSVPQPPYYLTMQMPGQETAEFSLTSVFVPGGESRREAMAGFLAVDSETGNEPGKVREGFGKLRLIALPSSTTVPGPGQVQNLYDSNQRIASQLNLLNLADSTVIRGNLLTLPVGGGLLYVQPVYVQGKGSASYPVLRAVLTSFGGQVGFAPTLQEALDQTFGGDAAATVTEHNGTSASSSEGDKKPETQQERLNRSLVDAANAMKEADKARQEGNWAAYGEAQKKLDRALTEALAAQEAMGNDLSGLKTDGDSAQSGALSVSSADSEQSR